LATSTVDFATSVVVFATSVVVSVFVVVVPGIGDIILASAVSVFSALLEDTFFGVIMTSRRDANVVIGCFEGDVGGVVAWTSIPSAVTSRDDDVFGDVPKTTRPG